MCAKKRFIVILSLLPLVSFAAQAKLPITDNVRKLCKPNSPCTLHVSPKTKPFKISFEIEQRRNLSFINKVAIQQQKKIQSFTFPEGIEGMHEGEVFPIFYDDVNRDGYQDILILSSKGAKEWLYHYLIFNSKSKKFVQQSESIPEVKKQGRKNLYSSSTGHKFELTKNLIFTAKN